MAPWEQQPNHNWHLYDNAGNIIDTRARNPDISPQEAMHSLLDYMPSALLAKMAARYGREADIRLDKASDLTQSTVIKLQHSNGNAETELYEANGLLRQCGTLIATARFKIRSAAVLLEEVGKRLFWIGVPSTDNENFVTSMVNQSMEKFDLLPELHSSQVAAAAAIDAARRLGVQHPDFGEARQAAIQSLSQLTATFSDPRYQLRPLAEALTTGSQKIPPRFTIHDSLPEDLVTKLAEALRDGVFHDPGPYGEQHHLTTALNAQATQAVITLLKEAGMSDHQMARDAYHARQQHRGEVFPAVGLYPENSWSGHAGSQSIGNPSGQPTTDVATTSHQRATTPPARPHRR
ncbi:hypothetical protein ACLQ25_00315 [Micromonospora sp. DT44]|uniref:hypothetical protein n=1 Tax=Micromonospora sp. DT44 TaxID=3393439 RepID=UPI003CFB8CFF